MSNSLTPTYAPTVAQTGSGDVLFISVDNGTTFVQLMGTQNIAYSNQKKDFEETTSTTSVGAYKEFKGTLKDPGMLTFEITVNIADPGQIALAAAYDSDTKLVVKHVYKAPAGFTTGPINTMSAEVEQDPLPGSTAGKVSKSSVSLKISGQITKTPAVV